MITPEFPEMVDEFDTEEEIFRKRPVVVLQ